MNTTEVASLHRTIKEREAYIEVVRAEASDLEKRAEAKWHDVLTLEGNLAESYARIEELEREG